LQAALSGNISASIKALDNIGTLDRNGAAAMPSLT
jgi:hypothetical protein